MILIYQHKACKSIKNFAEGLLSLKNAKEMLYLIKLNTIEESKNSILAMAKVENTFTAKKTLNQKNLKKLQKFFLVILEKL